jgi:hypothetical protein
MFANLVVFTERRGLTNAAHVTERVAYIATDRKDDLIAGLQAQAGVKFVHRPHSVKRKAKRQGRGILTRSTYRCQHGPADDTKSGRKRMRVVISRLNVAFEAIVTVSRSRRAQKTRAAPTRLELLTFVILLVLSFVFIFRFRST